MKVGWFLWPALCCVLFASSGYAQVLGSTWERVTGIFAKQCDVFDTTIWCVGTDDAIYRQVIGDETAETIGGGLKFVSAGKAGVWGCNSADNIYYREGTYEDATSDGTGWTQVEGGLKNIAVGDNIVVGTNSNDNIFRRNGITDDNPMGTEWEQIAGSCKQIDVYENNDIWCVNSADNIYRLTESGTWTQIAGGLKFISTGPGGVWGVNSGDNIYYRDGTFGNSATNDGTWSQVAGGLSTISVGETVVVGTSSNNEVWIRTDVSQTNPTGNLWRSISERDMKQCSVNDDDSALWCVTPNDAIFQFDLATRSWYQVEGGLMHIDAGPGGVWGVSADNKIWYRTGSYGNPDSLGTEWQMISGGLKNIAVGNNVVVGTNNNDDIYIRTGIIAGNPVGTDWQKLTGNAKQCGIYDDERSIWCVNSGDNIYKYLPDQQNWENVAGGLKYISAGYVGVWGVNSGDSIFHRVDTYDASGTLGSDWTKVTGSLRNVAVGRTLMLGTNSNDNIWIRRGIANASPEANVQYVDVEWQGQEQALKNRREVTSN